MGEKESEEFAGVERVKMLFCLPGVPPRAFAEVLQFRESVDERFGLIRSRDIPVTISIV